MAEGNGSLLRAWWPIIVVAGSGLIAWGSSSFRLASAEEDVKDNKARISQLERDIGEIKVSLAKIETTQTTSAADLERLRVEQARLTEALNALLRELQSQR